MKERGRERKEGRREGRMGGRKQGKDRKGKKLIMGRCTNNHYITLMGFGKRVYVAFGRYHFLLLGR